MLLWNPDASCDSNSADWRPRGSELDIDSSPCARVETAGLGDSASK